MTHYRIVIGNKNYSSWSLRGWLPLALCVVDFEEIVIPLRQPDTAERIRRHSPSGKVPLLAVEGLSIHESLAIAEFLAERHPDAGLWPDDPSARAVARAVSAEMHAGFLALRQNMPMDLRADRHGQGRAPGVAEDIARILEIWADCRARFGSGGDFLFGRVGIADAFYAPVVTRFLTYGVELDPAARTYCEAVMALPAMQDWSAAARAEPYSIDL